MFPRNTCRHLHAPLRDTRLPVLIGRPTRRSWTSLLGRPPRLGELVRKLGSSVEQLQELHRGAARLEQSRLPATHGVRRNAKTSRELRLTQLQPFSDTSYFSSLHTVSIHLPNVYAYTPGSVVGFLGMGRVCAVLGVASVEVFDAFDIPEYNWLSTTLTRTDAQSCLGDEKQNEKKRDATKKRLVRVGLP